jgi:hypothetical protein
MSRTECNARRSVLARPRFDEVNRLVTRSVPISDVLSLRLSAFGFRLCGLCGGTPARGGAGYGKDRMSCGRCGNIPGRRMASLVARRNATSAAMQNNAPPASSLADGGGRAHRAHRVVGRPRVRRHHAAERRRSHRLTAQRRGDGDQGQSALSPGRGLQARTVAPRRDGRDRGHGCDRGDLRPQPERVAGTTRQHRAHRAGGNLQRPGRPVWLERPVHRLPRRVQRLVSCWHECARGGVSVFEKNVEVNPPARWMTAPHGMARLCLSLGAPSPRRLGGQTCA